MISIDPTSTSGRRLSEKLRQVGAGQHFDAAVCRRLDEFHEHLAEAEAHVNVGTVQPAMRRFRGLARSVARLASRIVTFLAEAVTMYQRQFNRAALASLRSLCECLFEQQAALLAQEAEIGRLKHALVRRDRAAEQCKTAAAHSAGPPQPSAATSGCQRQDLDDLYVAFEDKFRGSRDEIKERQRVYLPLLKAAGLGGQNAPVLDIGCGRGEWLELLLEEGLLGRGLDINHTMVAECRQRNLEAAQGDLVTCLGGIPDGSLGAVTGFHIVEHLPFEILVTLLDETLRVLQTGGLAIFETPNPQNVVVGSCNFYLDPTHRHPLPSPLLKFMAEARGFTRVEIIQLHPRVSPLASAEQQGELARQFNELFYGPMDYALAGSKG